MTYHDDAVTFSSRYLDAIEQHLAIEFDRSNRPVFFANRISMDDICKLQCKLHDLLHGTTGINAVDAIRNASTSQIITVGFGLPNNFDSFIKLGLLCGERVVIWDIIENRLLQPEHLTPDEVIALGQAACNLLMLRKIVDDGVLVVLPHPTVWCSLAQDVHYDLLAQGECSPAKYGLAMALAVLDERLELHPFTLLHSDEQNVPGSPNVSNNALYTSYNYIFHQAIGTLLRDQRFACLDGASAVDFYSLFCQDKRIPRELRKLFSQLSENQSPLQRSQEVTAAIDELVRQIDTRNAAVAKWVRDATEASVSFVLAAATAICKPELRKEAALIAVGSICTRLWIAVRKWVELGRDPILIHAFKQLQAVPTGEDSLLIQVNPATQMKEHVSTVKDKFLSFDWIEQQSAYLKSLPIETVEQLLDSLDYHEIDAYINRRQYQHSYIGDYLAELWEISTAAFWEHEKISLRHACGILIDESEFHIYLMCSENMPSDVWRELLATVCPTVVRHPDGDYSQDCLARIIGFQTLKATSRTSHRVDLQHWYEGLGDEFRRHADTVLMCAFSGRFPGWLR